MSADSKKSQGQMDKFEKICQWAKMKADRDVGASDQSLDKWEASYYAELERLDDILKCAGPREYYERLNHEPK